MSFRFGVLVALSVFVGAMRAADAPVSGLANSDELYRKLREAAPAESFVAENLTLQRDAAVITLRSGTLTFTPEVNGRRTMALFTGEGEFRLDPQLATERAYLKSVTDKETLVEGFGRAVFVFTDGTWEEVRKSTGKPATLDSRAAGLLNDFRDRVRSDKYGDNIEAGALMGVYNPARAGAFAAFIFGKRYGDLRYFTNPNGVVPSLGPEETLLWNIEEGAHQGLLYMAHRLDEYTKGTASSHEDKRIVEALSYNIDTSIGANEHISAKATVQCRALADGDRVIPFGLLQRLRVSKVSLGGREIRFVQEDRKKDGSLYVILPEATKKGATYEFAFEYAGDQVVKDEGGGNFSIGARTEWYPALNAFADQAKYQLTFRVPKRYTLVSVGRLAAETVEGDQSVTKWVSDVPLAVAGFNYGEFKKKTLTDDATKYVIEGYATRDLPYYLRGAEEQAGAISPVRLIERTLGETQNSIRIFSDWFGAPPYGRIAITQQPQPNFGQSWPGLVYLPLISYLDATQRWQIMGEINKGLNDFIQEVTPHEVAHQWWGHMVGWTSFHDQWLSEGFADFSAGVYLHLTEPGGSKFRKFLEANRDKILEKNNYGRSPNDAGSLWMGLRLSTFKNQGAYNQLVYPKGGYVVHMLRMMMWDSKTGDEAFKNMMREFVATHLHKRASTESFKSIVEKHMTPRMDLQGNKRMDWFFRQWVYGTEVPRYKFDYKVSEQGGKTVLTGTLAQSGVSDNFVMPVPIYLDFDGRIVRLGAITMVGNQVNDKLNVELPKKPKRVMINYNYDVLAYKN